MTEDENVLDSILVEVGEFGKYQRRTCFFILICVVVTYFSSILFVFETIPVNHRCKIDGCDVEDNTEFKPDWWTNAIPSVEDELSTCLQYNRSNTSETCLGSDFTRETRICDEFVYETEEISILHDFDLQCDENVWKLTLVGTIQSIGSLVGLPIFGMLADRFGRKVVLIYGLVLSGILGLARSFANSYVLFVSLEFLEAISRAGLYPTIWTLGSELVGPKKRVLVTVLIGIVYSFAGVLEGSLAWIVQSWRVLLRIVYSLHVLSFVLYWFIPESVRWLLVKKRFAEAKEILEHLAQVNKKTISAKTIQELEDYELCKDKIETNTVFDLFVSRKLMLRLVNTAVCWACCIFLYNGLTINSVQLSSNSYLDYILTMVVEIPGTVAYVMVDTVGRKKPLAGGFFIAGVACITSIFVPKELHSLELCLYLLSKFGVSISVSVLYTITTEIFPTPFRNSLLSTCAMLGGIGAITGTQIPLLGSLWKPLPSLLFGSSGILAALLSVFFPETINVRLPNTIKEAENI